MQSSHISKVFGMFKWSHLWKRVGDEKQLFFPISNLFFIDIFGSIVGFDGKENNEKHSINLRKTFFC